MQRSAFSAWWQLLRAGNVFTAISNIIAGFLLARGEWQPLLPLVFLVLASAALYLAGMVLNDVYDLKLDRAERPERPLPSGRVDLAMAKIAGWGLVVCGLTATGVATWLVGSWLPLVVAVLLAIAIVAYDVGLKATQFGPLAMGACRLLNVLLGASVVSHSSDKYAAYLYAFVLGIYTVGLTLHARNEASTSTETDLRFAGNIIQLAVVLMLGLAALVDLPRFGWLAAWVACFLAVRVQLYEALVVPDSATVKKSVSRLITMFVLLDALACAAGAGWPAALVALTLLLPMYIATRRTPMT